MRYFILIFGFWVLLFAKNANIDATLLIEVMKENNKNLIKIIQESNKNLEDKINELDKRLSDKIDAVDKKLSNKIDAVDKKLSSKIDEVDKRLSNKIDVVYDSLQAQIRATNRRIDDVISIMLGMLAGLFAFVGFIVWDRRTMISKAKEEVKEQLSPEFDKRVDVKKFNEVVMVLRDFSHVNEDFERVVKRHNLEVA